MHLADDLQLTAHIGFFLQTDRLTEIAVMGIYEQDFVCRECVCVCAVMEIYKQDFVCRVCVRVCLRACVRV